MKEPKEIKGIEGLEGVFTFDNFKYIEELKKLRELNITIVMRTVISNKDWETTIEPLYKYLEKLKILKPDMNIKFFISNISDKKGITIEMLQHDNKSETLSIPSTLHNISIKYHDKIIIQLQNSDSLLINNTTYEPILDKVVSDKISTNDRRLYLRLDKFALNKINKFEDYHDVLSSGIEHKYSAEISKLIKQISLDNLFNNIRLHYIRLDRPLAAWKVMNIYDSIDCITSMLSEFSLTVLEFKIEDYNKHIEVLRTTIPNLIKHLQEIEKQNGVTIDN